MPVRVVLKVVTEDAVVWQYCADSNEENQYIIDWFKGHRSALQTEYRDQRDANIASVKKHLNL